MLILVYALNFLDRQILGILAKPIKEEFGLTDGQFGLMSGLAFALLYTTLAIPIAWLADRFSRVWIMTAALTLWSGFTALCGFAGRLLPAVPGPHGRGGRRGGRGGSGLFDARRTSSPSTQRARALAAYAFGIPLGTAAGTLVGGLLAVRFGLAHGLRRGRG